MKKEFLFDHAPDAHAASARIWKNNLQDRVVWKNWRSKNPIATYAAKDAAIIEVFLRPESNVVLFTQRKAA